MSITIDDSLGLNRVELQAMPIADGPGDIAAIAGGDVASVVSMVGSRHSQGGHTVANQGVAILTEPMNRVVVNYDAAGQLVSVTAQAGTTWNILQAVLAPLGYAPLVQQSSPHFTVGGSISVNCHGRDPNQGPLSTCVESLEVFVPGQGPITTKAGDALFKAVVGGYGSAGIILTATLRIAPNVPMQQQASEMSIDAYAAKLLAMKTTASWPALHYGWLNFSKEGLFETVLSVDCNAVHDRGPVKESVLNEDGWVGIELMRWLWEQHAKEPDHRDLTWASVCAWFTSQNNDNGGKGKENTRNGWLRQSIAFTAHRSNEAADLLQEYFVPLDQFSGFVDELRAIVKAHDVNLLSSTVRVVQPDWGVDGKVLTHLSYAPLQAMACIALDFEMPLHRETPGGGLVPQMDKAKWIPEAIDEALKRGGSYYLPYYGFATLTQFREAYDAWSEQKIAQNPRLGNRFTQTYLV